MGEQQDTAGESTAGSVLVENPLSVNPEGQGSPESAPEAAADDKMRWYVVQVYSGFEGKVRDSINEEIERQGLTGDFDSVVVPTEEVIELRRGAKARVEKKLLPSYILVRMHLSDETWHLVKNTPRVIDFLGADKVPAPISNSEARRMLRLTKGVADSSQTPAPRLSVSFMIGEQVRVSDGPFMSCNGVVESVDEERARLKVSVTIFGRATPVELDYTQVDKL